MGQSDGSGVLLDKAPFVFLIQSYFLRERRQLGGMGRLSLLLLASALPYSLFSPQFGSNSPCSPSPCGPGALCENKGLGNAICSCPPGQTGDPLVEGCSPDNRRRPLNGSGGRGGGGGFSFGSRGQSSSGFGGSVSNSGFGSNSNFGGSSSNFGGESCNRLSDCQFDRQCQGTPGRCVDPCTNNVETGRPPCGRGADCKATRYKAVCSCPRDHTGDPFVSCRPFTPEDLCRPNPCGPNAYCKPGIDNRTGEDRPVCLCNEGYRGNGVTGCTRGECNSLQHNTCPNDRACYDSSCIDPCGPTFCGGSPCCNPTANCRAVDHLAECSCPPGTEGEPRADRGGTCRRSANTRPGRSIGSRGVGGGNRGGSSGNLCQPNPCGQDAQCNVGTDRRGDPRPVCTCPRGYTGDALRVCLRGECFHDDECPGHLACFDYQCKDPCLGPNSSCGSNAQCKVSNHGPVCSCPDGYQGDPLSQCFRSRRG